MTNSVPADARASPATQAQQAAQPSAIGQEVDRESAIIYYNSAQQALRQCLPDQLKDETFKNMLDEDKSSRHWLKTLMKNLDIRCPAAQVDDHISF
uniref:RNA polymerase subunit sigma n=1 Tax=Heterorhabditis bacteriophora TaxID=37862 RepID=A0A1I7XH29_HETBA